MRLVDGRRRAGWLLVATAVLAGLSGATPARALSTSHSDASGESRSLLLEVADSEQERQTGLMGRTELGWGEGMLFVFSSEQILPFWMKSTPLPLSVAFLSDDWRVVGIADLESSSEETVLSPAPAMYALEANRGWFASNGVLVGEQAVYDAATRTISFPGPEGGPDATIVVLAAGASIVILGIALLGASWLSRRRSFARRST